MGCVWKIEKDFWDTDISFIFETIFVEYLAVLSVSRWFTNNEIIWVKNNLKFKIFENVSTKLKRESPASHSMTQLYFALFDSLEKDDGGIFRFRTYYNIIRTYLDFYLEAV
mgnify:CR=1 FL=1